ncbi:MAG: glutamine amidotransferase [Pirellulaceae bacterium]
MHWAVPYSSAVYIGAVVAIGAALYAARRWAISDSLRSIVLFLPRAAVLGLLLLVLLNPVRESAVQLPPRRPPVACLIDASRSMGLDQPATRLQQSKEYIATAQSLLDQASGAELKLFRFGSRFNTVPSLAELRAEDDRSQLAAAMRDVTGLLPEKPQAMIVVSDGQLGDAAELDRIARDYAEQGIAVHVLPVGSKDIRGDVAIERLVVPRGARGGDEVPVHVTVRSHGYGGRPVRLQVYPQRSASREPVAELPITLSDGSQSYDIVVTASPNVGPLVLSVPLQAEEAIESNNEVPFALLPSDRRIRVLYMEGTNYGGEYRYVQDALHDDPKIECVSLLVDNQYAARPRLAKVGDPYRGFPATRKELLEYDVVICSDISQGAFTPDQLQWTAELVRQRGGGFVMVGGHTSFGAGGWDQTVWDQLIPIDMRGGRVGQGFVNQQFSVQIPDDVRTHPIWRIVDDPNQNNLILSAIPPFFGTNVAERLKPAATLLGISAGPLTAIGQSPIFACQSYGRGRTFAMMTDTTEAWGSAFEKHWGEGDNRYFRKFWRNVVRWLSENSVAGQSRMVIESDKLIYRPGDEIQLTVETLDEDFQPIDTYDVSVTLRNAPSQADATATLNATDNKYHGSIIAAIPTPSAEDEASTLATATLDVVAHMQGEEVLRREFPLQILNDSDELLTPNAMPETLTTLANMTGGEVLQNAYDISRILQDLKSTPGMRVVHRTPLWDHPLLWLTMLSLVTTEWLLRRLRR